MNEQIKDLGKFMQYYYSLAAQREWLKYYDNNDISRNCGWIVRVIDGQLVKVAIVTTKSPPDYNYCCQL